MTHVGKYFPPVPGGMEKAVEQVVHGLGARDRFEVSCVVSHTGTRTVRERIGAVSVTRAARMATIASTPITPALKRAVAETRADIVHVHLPNPMATTALHNCTAPLVATYHCDVVRYRKMFRAYEPLLERFLDRCKYIVPTSRALIESSPVLRRWRHKCVVIPVTTGARHVCLDATQLAMAAEIRASVGAPFALFIGRLVRYKGLHHLIPAFRDVKRGKLVIVGTGPEREALQRLADQAGVRDRVRFVGFVDEDHLAAYIHAADAVALTSVDASEALGLSLLEGLAAGKPLLTTRLSTGVHEVNVPGLTGLDVPVGDVAAIARALNALFADEMLRARLGAAGREHFKQRFDLERVIDAHVDLYRVLAG